MPRFDGTGPSGMGPTGRGRGGCRGLNRRVQTRGGRMLGGMLLAVCGLVVNDTREPDGLTRRSVRSIGMGLRRILTGHRGKQKALIPPHGHACTPQSMQNDHNE